MQPEVSQGYLKSLLALMVTFPSPGPCCQIDSVTRHNPLIMSSTFANFMVDSYNLFLFVSI